MIILRIRGLRPGLTEKVLWSGELNLLRVARLRGDALTDGNHVVAGRCMT